MYRNAYQRGLLTIFYAGGMNPLTIWETRLQDGYINRFLDQDIKSMVLEIGGTNVSTSYMICPKGKTVLGITMPFLIMVVKNLKKYFSFEVTILDETGTRRRFRVSNFQSTTQILPLCTAMPICLSEGWNQIQFNLAEFTRRAYKKQYVEIQKLKVNANIRIRRIYFSERLLPDDQLPAEYKLFFPISSKGKVKKVTGEVKPLIEPPIVEKKKSSKTLIKDNSKASLRSNKERSVEEKLAAVSLHAVEEEREEINEKVSEILVEVEETKTDTGGSLGSTESAEVGENEQRSEVSREEITDTAMQDTLMKRSEEIPDFQESLPTEVNAE